MPIRMPLKGIKPCACAGVCEGHYRMQSVYAVFGDVKQKGNKMCDLVVVVTFNQLHFPVVAQQEYSPSCHFSMTLQQVIFGQIGNDTANFDVAFQCLLLLFPAQI